MKSPNICIAQSGLRILCRLHVEHPGQICNGQWGKVVGSNGDGTMGCVDFCCNKLCCKAVYFVPDVQWRRWSRLFSHLCFLFVTLRMTVFWLCLCIVGLVITWKYGVFSPFLLIIKNSLRRSNISSINSYSLWHYSLGVISVVLWAPESQIPSGFGWIPPRGDRCGRWRLEACEMVVVASSSYVCRCVVWSSVAVMFAVAFGPGGGNIFVGSCNTKFWVLT